MRILLVYPGPKHSTYDVAHGYEKALAAAGAEVWPFYYHNYLGFYDAALNQCISNGSDYRREMGDHAIMAGERVAIAAVDAVPDVALIIAGGALHRRAYDLLDKLNIPIALLLTESPYVDDLQTQIINQGHVAGVLTNELMSVATFMTNTRARVQYLPHSYDQEIHKPEGDQIPGEVFFHGTLWPERADLFKPLEALRYNVEIGGYELSEALNCKPCSIISNADMAAHYRGCKIALNHHRQYTDGHAALPPAWSLGPRAFEIAACGAFQLCDDTRGELSKQFGDTVATYHSPDDLRDKIAFYMEHETERQRMAEAARSRVHGCSFVDRAKKIVIPFLQEVLDGR